MEFLFMHGGRISHLKLAEQEMGKNVFPNKSVSLSSGIAVCSVDATDTTKINTAESAIDNSHVSSLATASAKHYHIHCTAQDKVKVRVGNNPFVQSKLNFPVRNSFCLVAGQILRPKDVT